MTAVLDRRVASDAVTSSNEWGLHWPKVLSGMVGMSFYAMLTYQFGLFIQPLEKEFGWSRGAMSLGLTIFTVAAVLLGPFVGALIDRIGSRVIAIAGTAVTALAVAALALANGSMTQWYLLWAAVAIGGLGIKSTIWAAGISSLFTASRGLALAVVLCGSAIAQSLAPLLANGLIASHGWRVAYIWLGLGWGGVSLLLVGAFFFDAHDHKRQASAAAAPVAPLGGLSTREALRDSRILRIAIANLLLSIVGAGVQVHLVPLLTGYGISRANAAEMAASAGLAGILGKLLTGWLLDRIRGNAVPVLSFALAAIGYLLLNFSQARPMLVLAIMILGYASGAGLQITTYLVSRYGGLRNFGRIYGTIGSMLMLGTALGPFLAGTVYDRTGSYHVLLLIAAPIAVLSALGFLGLGPYPDFGTGEQEGMASPSQPEVI